MNAPPTAALDGARSVIRRAIVDGIFPGASVQVGSSHARLWTESFGTLAFDWSARTTSHTLFDLASLTKVIATTTLVMDLVRTGALSLDWPVSRFFDEWRGADRADTTVRDLLEHASGLPARLVDAPPESRREFEHEICTIPLEYLRRARALYSDLDFILLGFLVQDCHGGASLARLFGDRLAAWLDEGHGERLTFGLPLERRDDAAPTAPLPEDKRAGRRLAGEVHDNYAAALGGAAGHAGLFGNAFGVGAFARLVLRAARGDRTGPAPFSPELVSMFTAKSQVPGSSRALGWDTMLPTSSCGTRMSAAAFGHVGFTGTSLWIDPERDRYFVLLANRVCGGGSSEAMQTVRRAFHDALGGI